MLATMFGKAKRKVLKKRLLPKSSGYLAAGFARAPPSAGPKMVPIVHINGITLCELARLPYKPQMALTICLPECSRLKILIRNHLSHNSPNDAHIAIRGASKRPSDHGPREGSRESEQKTRGHGTNHTCQDNRFSSKAIRGSAPRYAGQALAERKCCR